MQTLKCRSVFSKCRTRCSFSAVLHVDGRPARGSFNALLQFELAQTFLKTSTPRVILPQPKPAGDRGVKRYQGRRLHYQLQPVGTPSGVQLRGNLKPNRQKWLFLFGQHKLRAKCFLYVDRREQI
ncbi:hypothetical protein TNCV_1131161 [Trichonephila clavipes]|nr:hypothetical protein TNCV_1131161 [Trichonephila clavipes]